MSFAVTIGLGCIVALVLVLVSVYSRLITLRNRFKTAFGPIDVQLRRRHDLIANLADAVDGVGDADALTAVREARDLAADAEQAAANDPGSAAAIAALTAAEARLDRALAGLGLRSHPETPAPTAAAPLRDELDATDAQLVVARQAFNAAVAGYNVERQRVPAVLVAGGLGFAAAAPLEPAGAREAERPGPAGPGSDAHGLGGRPRPETDAEVA